MRLIYTHWKAGRVEREVTAVGGGLADHYKDRARIYFVSPINGAVFNAGRVMNGETRYSAPLRIGWSGSVTDLAGRSVRTSRDMIEGDLWAVAS